MIFMRKFSLDTVRKRAVLDYRANFDIEKSLEKLGVDIIRSYCSKNVMKPICGHPDITVFSAFGEVVVSEDSYKYYIEKIPDKKIEIGEKKLDEKYPFDVAYNLCCSEKFAIGNFKYVDKKVIDIVERHSLNKIHVSQGYSACSICVVDECSFITSDIGIYDELKKYNDIEVLKIDRGYIELEGFDYGFIGGSSARFGDFVVFFGDLKTHPNRKEIENFILSRGKKSLSLSKGPLKDLGGLRFID